MQNMSRNQNRITGGPKQIESKFGLWVRAYAVVLIDHKPLEGGAFCVNHNRPLLNFNCFHAGCFSALLALRLQRVKYVLNLVVSFLNILFDTILKRKEDNTATQRYLSTLFKFSIV